MKLKMANLGNDKSSSAVRTTPSMENHGNLAE